MTIAPAVAIGLSVAAGVLSTGYAAYSQKAAYDAQAKIDKQNQAIAEENARRAVDRAAQEAQDQDFENLGFLGTQAAGQAASGISGRSQVLAKKSANKLARLDALRIVDAGNIEAYNHKIQAWNFGNSAAMAKSAGKNSLVAGFIGGAGKIAGGLLDYSTLLAKSKSSKVSYD